MMRRPVSQLVDLLDPALNQLHNVGVEEARARVLRGDPAEVLGLLERCGMVPAARHV